MGCQHCSWKLNSLIQHQPPGDLLTQPQKRHSLGNAGLSRRPWSESSHCQAQQPSLCLPPALSLPLPLISPSPSSSSLKRQWRPQCAGTLRLCWSKLICMTGCFKPKIRHAHTSPWLILMTACKRMHCCIAVNNTSSPCKGRERNHRVDGA